MTRTEAESILKKKFGIEKFYDTQWFVIEKILRGERVLLIEKTGFGKSLCFQFPALQFDGTTIIFSPLIALMRDQIKKMNELGISAKCINSNQSMEENSEIIAEAKENKIKLLYIAPERMENAEWLQTARQMKISMVVVDEAHCISVWGHDFRPSYRRIANLIKLLPAEFPVLATTATATKRTEEDIMRQIGKDMLPVRGNLMRDNFMLRVIKVNSEDEKYVWLAENINKINGSGIIYTGTQVNTELYAKWLEYMNIPAVAYNGGMEAEVRKDIEKGLIENRWKCVVSTNALGMGIDKPDIRFIIHTQIPQSPIHYYQEIGRAGRDNKLCYAILFYNPEDLDLPTSFIDNARPPASKYYRLIEAIKEEPMSEHQIIKKTNLKSTLVKVIIADLIDQNIISDTLQGRRRVYEYRFKAPELNIKAFDELRDAKYQDLFKMTSYAETKACRMKFLCNYLDDNRDINCGKCDNDTGRIIKVDVTDEWARKLDEYRSNYFPVLEVETTRTKLINGVAASYYGQSNVGATIHRCKYEHGGDFPDILVKMTLKAFREHFDNVNFDLLVYVPPTESGDLVMNFSQKIAQSLRIPISYSLKKIRNTEPQKGFENGLLKRDNVADAFEFAEPSSLKDKSILIIDDIFDSGATIKEIGKLLTKLGANNIAPLVIAKTMGGDKLSGDTISGKDKMGKMLETSPPTPLLSKERGETEK
jgi:ATP-dependent DNA helicase RecQ